MALSESEISRIQAELGYNILTTGALPYIGITQVFSQVIKNNVRTGATTTSSTTVSAASTPTPVSLTLASATGFAAGDRLVIDVDELQETATARSLTGAVVSVALRKSHSGTYPVSVESGETIVRELLARIAETKAKLATAYGSGALKRVDEVEFYQTAGFQSAFGVLGENLAYWRSQLAAALGVPNFWAVRGAGAQTLSVY